MKLNAHNLTSARATTLFAQLNGMGNERPFIVAQLVAERKAFWDTGDDIGDPNMQYGLSASQELGGEPLIAVFKTGQIDIHPEFLDLVELLDEQEDAENDQASY